MENKKLEQLQKMYEDGLITEDELKTKRKKIISEIIDSSNSENSVKDENTTEKPKKKHKFIKILKDVNLRQSMSRGGNYWDNADQESFFYHMKD